MFAMPVQYNSAIPETIRIRVRGHYAYFKIISFSSRDGFLPRGIYSSNGETCARAELRSRSVHVFQAGYLYRIAKHGQPLPLDYVRVNGHHLAAYLPEKGRPLIAFSRLGIRIILPLKGESPTRSENPVIAVDNRFQYPNKPLRRHFLCLNGTVMASGQGKLNRKDLQVVSFVYAPSATQADYLAFKTRFHFDDHHIVTFDGDTACNSGNVANSHVGIVRL